jgi:hypothetical protein
MAAPPQAPSTDPAFTIRQPERDDRFGEAKDNNILLHQDYARIKSLA